MLLSLLCIFLFYIISVLEEEKWNNPLPTESLRKVGKQALKDSLISKFFYMDSIRIRISRGVFSFNGRDI